MKQNVWVLMKVWFNQKDPFLIIHVQPLNVKDEGGSSQAGCRPRWPSSWTGTSLRGRWRPEVVQTGNTSHWQLKSQHFNSLDSDILPKETEVTRRWGRTHVCGDGAGLSEHDGQVEERCWEEEPGSTHQRVGSGRPRPQLPTHLHATGHAQNACDDGDGPEDQTVGGEAVRGGGGIHFSPAGRTRRCSAAAEHDVTCRMRRSFPPHTDLSPRWRRRLWRGRSEPKEPESRWRTPPRWSRRWTTRSCNCRGEQTERVGLSWWLC